jgi:hypothetical protein
MVEFSTKPTQAVLGDQDAFKLEYIGNSITLKPVVQNAKSNLFVYTEWGRFTFTVSTVAPGAADYLVKVAFKSEETKVPAARSPKRIPVSRSATAQGFTLSVKEIEMPLDLKNPRGSTLIRFELSSTKKPYSFQPASLGLKQGSQFIPIDQIYLDQLELKPKANPIHGSVVLLNADWNPRAPIALIFAVSGSHSKPIRLVVSLLQKNKTEKSRGANENTWPAIFK